MTCRLSWHSRPRSRSVHLLMHLDVGANGGKLRERVEAEWVAFVVCDAVRADSADYSIPEVT